MRVKAKRAVSYNKRLFGAGQEFEMPDKDAKVLKALGRVVFLEAKKPVQPVPHEVHEPKAKKKGTYKRRDQVAEDQQSEDVDKGE